MDLLQPDGPRPNGCCKLLPMGRHAHWVIADMVAKVKAVEWPAP